MVMKVKPRHACVKNITMDKTGFNTVELSDGSILTGIVDGEIRINSEINKVLLTLTLHGTFTINGECAKDAFTKTPGQEQAVVVPTHAPLVGPDGKPLS